MPASYAQILKSGSPSKANPAPEAGATLNPKITISEVTKLPTTKPKTASTQEQLAPQVDQVITKPVQDMNTQTGDKTTSKQKDPNVRAIPVAVPYMYIKKGVTKTSDIAIVAPFQPAPDEGQDNTDVGATATPIQSEGHTVKKKDHGLARLGRRTDERPPPTEKDIPWGVPYRHYKLWRNMEAVKAGHSSLEQTSVFTKECYQCERWFKRCMFSLREAKNESAQCRWCVVDIDGDEGDKNQFMIHKHVNCNLKKSTCK